MMTSKRRSLAVLANISILALGACSQSADTAHDGAIAANEAKPLIKYMLMEDFSPEFGEFVGLVKGETFAQSEPKINAVFTAYDGHVDPVEINTVSNTVEADWTQVLVTQDGLMDGTISGQQLLAIYDQDGKLITYGMRIKCHNDDGISEWQNTICEG